jgi:hypothetical protein
MNKEESRHEFIRVTKGDEWLTARELAPLMKMSPSSVYSLVRRESGIPFARISPAKILFNWKSVNRWLHDLEVKKRKRNFED